MFLKKNVPINICQVFMRIFVNNKINLNKQIEIRLQIDSKTYKLSQTNFIMTPYQIKNSQQARMSVPNNLWAFSVKNKDQRNVKFRFSDYPFPNHPISAEMFSTIVQCNINKEKVEKITNMKCENVISLKKIVKLKLINGNTQQNIINLKQSKQNTPTYSFYYEKVQYSLGHILSSNFKQHPEWLQKVSLSRVQIKKTLANLVAMLYKIGIVLFLQFSQIGINLQGIIKVYIAPNVLFDDFDHNPKAKVLVLKSLHRVLKCIDANYPKFQKQKNHFQQSKLNDLSIENEIMQIQQSIIIGQSNSYNKNSINEFKFKNGNKELLFDEEKCLNSDQVKYFFASGSTNLDNLKIQQKILKSFQNEKIATKAQQNMKKHKNKISIQTKQKHKIDQLTVQLQQIRQKLRSRTNHSKYQNFYAQKEQKNFTTQDKARTKQTLRQEKDQSNLEEDHQQLIEQNKKTKKTLSSVNFYTGKIPHQKNINCVNIYQTNDKYMNGCCPNEDLISVDTYQLEIGDDYRMPKIVVSMGLRNSLKTNKKRKSSKMDAQTQEKQKNSSKARVHESAGGKNYGYIVNLLKPQFQPKKSNIYQEPSIENEQQQKESVSIQKDHQYIIREETKKKTFINNQNLNLNNEKYLKRQKPKNLIDQYQQDLQNLFGNKRLSFSHFKSHQPIIQKRATLPQSKQKQQNLKSPEIPSNFLNSLEQKEKNKQKSFQMYIKNLSLQQKLKKAMQKTKKAIFILNKAKQKQKQII